jgi:transposase
MAGKAGQKKRFWSDDEKRSICAQTTTAGVSVAQVARRYGMNANLIHKWLRDPRFGPVAEGEYPKLGIETCGPFYMQLRMRCLCERWQAPRLNLGECD